MTENGGQKTDPQVQEELSKRIACLYDMIRSAESSRCLVDWIGTQENFENINRGGYGQLFGHIQYVAYCDFILNTVALFEPDKEKYPASSFVSLFDYICANKSKIKVTGFSRISVDEDHNEDRLCNFICALQNRLPKWFTKKVEPDSLDAALIWMRTKRDKVIAHREFKGIIAPRASIDMIRDGCGLLPLAIELYDQIYRIAEPDLWQHFTTSITTGDGNLDSIRHISTQFEKVINGEFAEKRNPVRVSACENRGRSF